MISKDQIVASFCTSPVKVPGYWICVLCALAFLLGLFPLRRVPLGLDANTACVLEDVTDDQEAQDDKGCPHPYRILLEMSIVGTVVRSKVSPVDCVEHTCWLE